MNSALATQGALRRHFDQLYSTPATDLDRALQDLLPPSLAAPRVLALRSSAFLTIAGWERLLARVRDLAAAVECRGRPLRILDLGCGIGRVGRELATAVDGWLTGIDFAEGAVTAASDEQGSNAEFVHGDILDLPFDDASFDIVLALDTLHLVDDSVSALQEVRRVIAPDGMFTGATYRLMGSAGGSKTLGQWQRAVNCAGFSYQDWVDVTGEWRLVMRDKHASRWRHRGELVEKFGARAAAECDVSRQMLGTRDSPGFIARNERWEFCVKELL